MNPAHKVIALSVFFGLLVWGGVEATDWYYTPSESDMAFVSANDFKYTHIEGFFSALCFLVFGAIVAKMLAKRRKVEEALRESQAKLQDLFDVAPVGYHELDPEGRISRINRTELDMLGYSAEEMIGKPIFEFVLEREEVRQTLEAKVQGIVAPDHDYECTCRRKDGSLLPVLIQDRLLRDGAGRITGIRSAMQDITTRQETEQELLNYQGQLRSLGSRLALAEERERRQIATELHDRIGGTLALASMKLGTVTESLPSSALVESVNEVRELLTQTVRDTRSLTFEISPPILYRLGLEPALEWLTEQIHEHHGVPVQFEDDDQQKPLDDDVRIILFQAVRELLLNVAKHAKADRAKVSVTRNLHKVRICVEDDGVGFEAGRVGFSMSKDGGFGLFNVRERLQHLGGCLEVRSEAGRGTVATLVAPLKAVREPCRQG